MKLKREYLIILIIQITEVLGFSLILPFLPYYAEDLGANPFTIGLILSSFSFFQFISAPILGKISDSYGRRPLLMLSQLSTFISFLMLAFSKSLGMIFLSRAVDGILGSNFTIAQAYLSDVSSEKERSKAFAISGIAFGFGFLVGPAIGGFLAQSSFSTPALLAAFVSLLTIVTTYFFLPETVKVKKNLKLDFKIINVSDFTKYFSNKLTSNRLLQFFAFILAHVTWVSSFALFAKRKLGFGTSQIGFLLAYIGLISIVIRGFFISKLIDVVGEEKLKKIGAISVIIGLLLASVTVNWWMLVIVMTFFAFGAGVARPLMMGSISRSVSAKHQGEILGFANSLGSLAQIIAPLIGGLVLNYLGTTSLAVIASLIMTVGLVIMNGKKNKFSCT